MTTAQDSTSSKSKKSNRMGAPGHKAPAGLRKEVEAACDKHTSEVVAAHCGLSEDALIRLMAGAPVRSGTIAQVELGLQKPVANGAKKVAKKKGK